MKKKYKAKNIPSGKPEQNISINLKSYILSKIKINKILIIMFLIGFSLAMFNAYSAKDVNVGEKYTGDATHYYNMAKTVSKEIYPRLFSFIGGVLTDSFSKQEYQKMGFLENDITSIYRAPSVIFLFGFLFFIFGISPHVVLIANAIIFGLCLLMAYKISMMLFKKNKIAYILCGIYAFYLPYHQLNMFLLTEVVINMALLLLMYFYIKAVKTSRSKYYFLIGMTLYILALMKISIQYLGYLIIILLIYQILKQKINRKKLFISFLAGIFIIMLPWKLTTYRASGEFDLSSITISSVTKATSGRVGWVVIDPEAYGFGDNTGRSHSPYFRDNINKVDPKYKNNPWFYYSFVGGYAWKSALKKEPVRIFLQTIYKFMFFLTSPMENAVDHIKVLFKPLLGTFNNTYHNLIILFGLLVIFFPHTDFPSKSIFYAILLYHYSVNSFTLAEYRFNTTAISSFILLSGYLFLWIGNNYLKLLKLIKKQSRIIINIGLILLNIILIIVINHHILKKVILPNTLILSGAFLAYQLSKAFIKKRKALLSGLIIILFFCSIYNTVLILRKDIDRYFLTLTKKNNSIIKQEIVLPKNLDLNEYDSAVAAIDIKTRKKNNSKIIVKVNDKIINVFENGLTVPKGNLYYLSIVTFEPEDNKWVFLKFDPKLLNLNKKNKITIETIFKDNSNSQVLLTYDKNDDFPYFHGKSFFRNILKHFRTYKSHFTRLVDTRITKSYKLQSTSSKSYIIKNNKSKKLDGQMRVRLLLKHNGGYFIHKKHAALNKYYFGFIALINPVDKKLVMWHKKQPKDYIPIEKNLWLYLATEKDRYYTGYDIF